MEGLEDRCLLSMSFFPVPTPASPPWSITSGPDGNLWFTESWDNKVGVINPTTYAISDFTVPTGAASPVGIAAGPDGNLWFTEQVAGKIGMINPTTYAMSEFAVPAAGAQPYAITPGPDGNLWFTDYNAGPIGMINPATHVITQFAIPTADAAPYGITAGPDGNLWFTEWAQGKVGRINPTTFAISEFSTPVPYSHPDAITAGPDGNLWFTDDGNTSGNSYIGTINPTTGVISEFYVGPYYSLAAWNGITSGPDGNLWFTNPTNGVGITALGKIDPATQVINLYDIPAPPSNPVGITAGPDGNLWFTDQNKGIGVNYLKNLVVSAQPPASVTAGSSFSLTVQAEDSSGNLITSFNGQVTVTLASNPGGSTLGGTLTVPASGGVATFSGLTLNKAASGYTLVATTSGLGQGVSNAVTVTPAAATQLVITQQPATTVKLNSPFALKASIEDAFANVVTTASGTVSVAFASNPTGATLGGTLSVTANQGVASFTNLTINKVGSGYALRVSSSGLTSAVSNSINVTKSGKSPTPVSSPAGVAAHDLALAPLVLDSPDLWNGPGHKKRFGSILKSV
jgi:virginiamycin B lyase